jgi:hypothetical protein
MIELLLMKTMIMQQRSKDNKEGDNNGKRVFSPLFKRDNNHNAETTSSTDEKNEMVLRRASWLRKEPQQARQSRRTAIIVASPTALLGFLLLNRGPKLRNRGE